MSDKPWGVRIPVRSYELDSLGHLNHAVYHQYAEIARTEGFAAAGCDWGRLIAARTVPVLLSTTVHFRREIRAGETVEATCVVDPGTGKVFTMDTDIVKADGVVAAEVSCVLGIMDLDARKLVADPRAVLAGHGLDWTRLSR